MMQRNLFEGVQRRFTVGIGQFKPTKGQYRRNLERIGDLMRQSLQEGVDVLALPETATTGYFVEGGVRELAIPATQLLHDLTCSRACSGGLRSGLDSSSRPRGSTDAIWSG